MDEIGKGMRLRVEMVKRCHVCGKETERGQWGSNSFAIYWTCWACFEPGLLCDLQEWVYRALLTAKAQRDEAVEILRDLDGGTPVEDIRERIGQLMDTVDATVQLFLGIDGRLLGDDEDGG